MHMHYKARRDDSEVLWEDCYCPPSQADPDIAGIGVVSAFVASSCLSIVSTCLYLILIRANLSPEESFNPLDRYARTKIATRVVSYLRRIPALDSDSRLNQIEKSLFALVQSLGDMQLVTGVAMLSAATIKLNHGSIITYHFHMVTNLAWLSSNVHLMTLLAIRTHVYGSMKRGRRFIYPILEDRWARVRNASGRSADVVVRVVGMLAMAGLLLYCTYISGAEGWYDNYACPASCAIGRKKAGEPFRWLAASFFLILYTYPIRCLQLWPTVWQLWLDRLRHRILDDQGLGVVQKNHKKLSIWRKVALAATYFLDSEFFDVLFSGFMWCGLGVWWIFEGRNDMHRFWRNEQMSEQADRENTIDGFGQLVPLFLVGAPLLQAIQRYCEQSRAIQRRAALNLVDWKREVCHW